MGDKGNTHTANETLRQGRLNTQHITLLRISLQDKKDNLQPQLMAYISNKEEVKQGRLYLWGDKFYMQAADGMLLLHTIIERNQITYHHGVFYVRTESRFFICTEGYSWGNNTEEGGLFTFNPNKDSEPKSITLHYWEGEYYRRAKEGTLHKEGDFHIN